MMADDTFEITTSGQVTGGVLTIEACLGENTLTLVVPQGQDQQFVDAQVNALLNNFADAMVTTLAAMQQKQEERSGEEG